MSRLGRAVTISLVLLLPAVPGPARGTFPGSNGAIAFVRDANIWKMWPDGSHQRQLTWAGSSYSPAWSPDGRLIAYERWTPVTGSWDIWVMRANGSGKIRITTHPAFEADPAWSPDGHSLVFESTRRSVWPDVTPTLWKLHFPKPYGLAVQVTRNPNDPEADFWGDRLPEWSPDGSRILFTRFMLPKTADPDLYWNLATVRPDGTGFRNITKGSGDREGTWSPAMTRIGSSILSYDDEGIRVASNIRHRTISGDAAVAVTHYPPGSYLMAGDPSWSPNGRRIVYALTVNFDASSSSIWIARASGIGSPIELTAGQMPAWRPISTG
jgi:Tol biopolymer transport system component